VTQISTDGRKSDESDPVEGNGASAVRRDAEPDAAEGGRRGMTEQQKKVLAVVAVVHLIVATFTLRDLKRRPADAVRGPKGLWRLWAVLNTTGSVAYWLFGRRTAD
jgi:hypothetical protein